MPDQVARAEHDVAETESNLPHTSVDVPQDRGHSDIVCSSPGDAWGSADYLFEKEISVFATHRVDSPFHSVQSISADNINTKVTLGVLPYDPILKFGFR